MPIVGRTKLFFNHWVYLRDIVNEVYKPTYIHIYIYISLCGHCLVDHVIEATPCHKALRIRAPGPFQGFVT